MPTHEKLSPLIFLGSLKHISRVTSIGSGEKKSLTTIAIPLIVSPQKTQVKKIKY